jgi:iron complex outermembrane recepter protein
MKNFKEMLFFASALALGGTMPAYAQEDEAASERKVETVTVTGSFIQGTPEDAALPVDVVGRAELDQIGSPSINEIMRNLPATQGLIGETNQFDTRGGQANEGASTVNLRGLGSARTLVLLNGKRHVSGEGLGVDLGIVPLTAVQRVEVLKDGAAALYGSDAIAGVVNFITRDDFEGVEVRGSHQFIADSDGDSEIGAIWGHDFGALNLMVAAEYGTRGELQIKDRDWALRPFAENPQGGYSSIGNPGTFFGGATPRPDPNCNALGGTVAAGFCRFQYTFFDNLIEDTQSVKLLGVATYELGDQKLRLEGGFSEVELAEWKTSPAYPPQSLLGPDRLVLPNHPGRLAFMAANPTYAANFNPAAPIIFWGRYLGVNGLDDGQPETGKRLINQYRAAFDLSGPLFDGAVNYDLGITWSSRDRKLEFTDMFVERSAFALRGLGGPGCNPATGTPGVGSCLYFNPFSNAFPNSAVTGQANPFFNPAVANSEELLDWMVGSGFSGNKNELLVADIVFNGETKWSLPGGVIGYAVGAQSRNEIFELSISRNFDLNVAPCPFNNPASITQGFVTTLSCAGRETGQFAFLSGAYPDRFERSIYGAFGELALPFSDNFNVQLAARFEDYGASDGGSTFDPKLAFKWQVADPLAVRGSVGTTFRGAPQGALLGRFTALAFVGPTNAFKALDTVGNPDLGPEKALSANLGVLFDAGGFTGSLDYWRFDFEDQFQIENADQTVGAYVRNACANGGAGVATPICQSLRSVIFPLGTAPAGITRIERQTINGANVVTDGLDFAGKYAFEAGPLDLTVGAQGTYTLKYESEDFLNRDGFVLAPGGDFVGFLNEPTPFQPLVPFRGSLYGSAETGPHLLTYNLRYVDGYKDQVPSLPALAKIDSQITHDLTYSLSLFEGDTRFSLSVYNATDEDPPFASTDVNYDPYTHNAFGRMIKIGFTQKFGPGD